METEEINLINGDSSGAFGQTLLSVKLDDPENFLAGHTITKCELRIENVLITIKTPEFPLSINLTSQQSMYLSENAEGYMAIYDENGQKLTLKGKVNIKTSPRRV